MDDKDSYHIYFGKFNKLNFSRLKMFRNRVPTTLSLTIQSPSRRREDIDEIALVFSESKKMM